MREWPHELEFWTTDPPDNFDTPVEILWTNKDGSVSKLSAVILSADLERPRMDDLPLLTCVRVGLRSPEPEQVVPASR